MWTDELDESVVLAVADRDGIHFIHQATRRRALSLSFRIGDLLPAERTAPGPLFAADWTPEEWTDRRARRAADPEDRTYPAVPPRPPSAESDVDEEFVRRAARAATDSRALDDQLIEPGLVSRPPQPERPNPLPVSPDCRPRSPPWAGYSWRTPPHPGGLRHPDPPGTDPHGQPHPVRPAHRVPLHPGPPGPTARPRTVRRGRHQVRASSIDCCQ
ncbi:hypothetical protein ACIREM_06650 [Streptomyces shenzhenensis]|uniref:hypothetical protein n=1 Tax=Streptomyces shenzhenensis TaxID=943815 RepID=UPI00382861D1